MRVLSVFSNFFVFFELFIYLQVSVVATISLRFNRFSILIRFSKIRFVDFYFSIVCRLKKNLESSVGGPTISLSFDW